MKTLLFALALAMTMSVPVMGQTLEFHYNNTLINSGDTLEYLIPTAHLYDTHEIEFDITNTDSGAQGVMVRRTNIYNAYGSSNSFCWGVACYPPVTNVCAFPESIDPSASKPLKAEYKPFGSEESTLIRYTAWNSQSAADSVWVYLWVNPDGTANISEPQNSIQMEVYPNPVQQSLNLSFSENAQMENLRVEVLNTVGAVVMHKEFKQVDAKLQLDIEDLSEGVYWVRVQAGENAVLVQKIIKL